MGGEIWADLRSRLNHLGPEMFLGDVARNFTPAPLERTVMNREINLVIATPAYGRQLTAVFSSSRSYSHGSQRPFSASRMWRWRCNRATP